MVRQDNEANTMLELLRQKRELVNQMYVNAQHQVLSFQDDEFDEDLFERTENKKEEYITRMNLLNTVFEEVYPEAKRQIEDLIQAKDPIAEQIHEMALQLEQVSKQYELEESKVKLQLQEYLNRERKKLRNRMTQRNSAATYYKTMTKQMEQMSYFYDKKQ